MCKEATKDIKAPAPAAAGGKDALAETYITVPWRNPVLDGFYALWGVFNVFTFIMYIVTDKVVFYGFYVPFYKCNPICWALFKAYMVLENAVGKAMMKNPDDRQQTMMFLYHCVYVWPMFTYLAFFSEWKADWTTVAKYVLWVGSYGLSMLTTMFGGLTHVEGHQVWTGGVFNKTFNFLNGWTEWGVLPFMGRVPESGRLAHVLCHHKYCNNLDDVECHLFYNRGDMKSFVFHYNPRMFFWRHTHVGYFWTFMREGRTKHAWQTLRGMVMFFGMAGSILYFNGFAAFYFMVFMGMNAANFAYNAGEWGMHAFCDPNNKKKNHVVRNSTVLSDETDERESSHSVHHAFNTSMPANRKVEERQQLATLYVPDDIPYIFTQHNWTALFKSIVKGDEGLTKLAVNWNVPEVASWSTEEKVNHLRSALEPINLKTWTIGELEEYNLIGPANKKKV